MLLIKFNFGGYSDLGVYRDRNEDSIYISSKKINNLDCLLGVVCDGVGGTNDGEFASSEVVYQLIKWFETFSFDSFVSIKDDVLIKIQNINAHLVNINSTNKTTGATTLSMILIYNSNYHIFNAGDSRIYKFKYLLTKTTKDDVELKKYKLNEKMISKNILTEFIGKKDDLKIFHSCGKIFNNTSFLICSDGFYKRINNKQICNILKKINIDDNIESLILYEVTNRIVLGEKDNITAGIIKLFN